MTQPALSVVRRRHERLRVITAGDVGNVQSRLGSSGFDVVAVVDTEADLVVAVSTGDPDAIVVEADLCESLEHVHELAPEAAVIVVGDRTPAGAIGHIDRGVSGTVLARLLQALAAGGTAAIVAIPGFTPGPGIAPAHGASAAGSHAVHGAVVGGVTATAVAAIVVGAIVIGGSPAPERAERVEPLPTPIVSTPPEPPPSVLPREPVTRRSRPHKVSASPVAAARSAPEETPVRAPRSVSPSPEPPPSPPPPPAVVSPHPPGHAKGWEHKPPKHTDHGNHEGWDKPGHGPK